MGGVRGRGGACVGSRVGMGDGRGEWGCGVLIICSAQVPVG